MLRRNSEDRAGMLIVSIAVLVPSDEPQSPQREIVPAAILCKMVLKTSKRISEYMGNVGIILINGEKDPSCVSHPEDEEENVSSNDGRKESQQKEELSSGGTAGVAVSIIVFMIILIMGAVYVLR